MSAFSNLAFDTNAFSINAFSLTGSGSPSVTSLPAQYRWIKFNTEQDYKTCFALEDTETVSLGRELVFGVRFNRGY